MNLYVYCIGEDLRGDAFEEASGVGGARARVLSLGRLSAVVSDAGAEPDAATEENLLAHNRVNAVALAHTTPLPCRFGMNVSQERLAEYVSANETALLAALARVRGYVEMSVKIMFNAKGARRGAEGGRVSELTTGGAAPDATLGGSGLEFLLKKRRELMGEEEERRRTEEAGVWLAAGVGELARETNAHVNPSEAIVVRAGHLVERVRVEDYRARLRALAAERPDLRLLTSGPWPPYSFSDISGQNRPR